MNPLTWPPEDESTASRGSLLRSVLKVFGTDACNPQYRVYRQFRKIVSLRTNCENLWYGDADFLGVQETLNRIIAEEMHWPQSRFVPDDPCDILFFDPLADMDAEMAFMRIEDTFGVTIDSSEILKMRLRDLVCHVIRCSRPN